ncbi:membrane protein insertase YidC [Ruminococcus sp. HUN007]|uniref:YidC/Oxa1 family membrane protein insertase n=1 Tax=Ruminococcus sp. HUN007 TaxID=1514668 RepID=UPI0006785701|nr:membrane protein insertase YidC [Ruminococcus sp. HUN007]
MSRIIDFLIGLLGHIMSFCYGLTGNYGLSIILFTLITKLFLFPIGLLTQKNAIRMAQLQPELDQLRMKYVDDKDKFADAQLELYKKYKYNPFLDVLPLCLQIPLVLGLIGVVYRPLNFILHLDEQVISTLKERLFALTGETDAGNLYQMKIIEAVRTGAVSPEGISEEAVNRIMNFSMFFAGIDLGRVPYQHILDPVMIVAVFAGISAALLCFAQNKINVLQMAQGKTNKILTTLFMVSFSLYFAMIVPGSIGLYWIAGNLFAIPVMLLTNTVLPPKKICGLRALT